MFSFQIQEDLIRYIVPQIPKNKLYGTSSTVQVQDLCIQPLYAINEYIFMSIWIWFMLLVILLAMVFVYRIVLGLSPGLRSRLLRIRNDQIPSEVTYILVRKTDIGGWWFIYMLAKNMDATLHAEITAKLATNLPE